MRQKIMILITGASLMFQSCATILGGPVTDYQRTKPVTGEPKRPVRGGALIADILLTGPIGVIVDFGTCAIYKPEKKK